MGVRLRTGYASLMNAVDHHYWAPGKLLLFGEHSAVFGYPAAGSALTRGLHVSVTPAERMTLAIGGEAHGAASDTEGMLTRFGQFLWERAPHLPPSRVEIVSDLPISSGFGSSAALCTALAQWSLTAATPGTGERPTSREIWRLAHALEAYFHGTPSGIDTGLAALGGVQAFHFESARKTELPDNTPLSGELPPLVVGSIPRGRSTRELVAMVRRQHEEDSTTINFVLSQLGSLAEDAITCLSRKPVSPAALGEIASTAHTCLSDLGVSSPTLDRILQTGSGAGALGGKLSGAGDGGAFYLVCPDSATATAVHAAVSRELPPGGTALVM